MIERMMLRLQSPIEYQRTGIDSDLANKTTISIKRPTLEKIKKLAGDRFLYEFMEELADKAVKGK